MGDDGQVKPSQFNPKSSLPLLFSIFTIAICGLVYELIAGALSSYLIGDSVYQFSIIIGIFMSSMGLGSFLSRYINRKLPECFVIVEVLLGLIGGFSSIALFFAFAKMDNYTAVLIMISVGIGVLVGLEIPLILRILKDHSTLKIMVSNVLTADYVGALVGALLFPLVLVPYLGLIKTGLFFGLLNLTAAGMALYIFKSIIANKRQLIAFTLSSAFLLIVTFVFSTRITTFLEDSLYSDEIIYSTTTPYQRVVITRNGADISMFINGSIQFNTMDEYRYHEALVHPALSLARRKDKILILGGGDGLAAREMLKHSDVGSITIVDIDKSVTDLFKNKDLLTNINKDSLSDPKVKIVNKDAWKFLESNNERYNLIYADLPDPHDFTISKLYSRSFYRMLFKHLTGDGIFVTQATSPLYARDAFWCVEKTLAEIASPGAPSQKLFTQPYHLYLPSFGEWGFIMASPKPISWKNIKVSVPTKYLSNEIVDDLINFPKDMARTNVEANSIDTHQLTRYYEKGWGKWYK